MGNLPFTAKVYRQWIAFPARWLYPLAIDYITYAAEDFFR